MDNPPFKSDIVYSVQNEDYETELAILRRIDRGAPLRVLMIASSGENALSLLTQKQVARVHAIDINPAQIHLCELRRTALIYLTRDDQLRLLGIDPVRPRVDDEAARQTLFDRICPYLPESTRLFWIARRAGDRVWRPSCRTQRPCHARLAKSVAGGWL